MLFFIINIKYWSLKMLYIEVHSVKIIQTCFLLLHLSNIVIWNIYLKRYWTERHLPESHDEQLTQPNEITMDDQLIHAHADIPGLISHLKTSDSHRLWRQILKSRLKFLSREQTSAGLYTPGIKRFACVSTNCLQTPVCRRQNVVLWGSVAVHEQLWAPSTSTVPDVKQIFALE